jgi:hypothetical protein
LSSGINLRIYSNLCKGIRFNDSVELFIIIDEKGIRCGQTGDSLLAKRVPLQWVGVTGGINLKEPMGGVAYGTPKKASIVCKVIELICDDNDCWDGLNVT